MTHPSQAMHESGSPSAKRTGPGSFILSLASVVFWSSVWVLLRGSVTGPGLVVALIMGTMVHLGVRAVFGAPPGVLEPRHAGRVLYRTLALISLFLRELAVSNVAQLRIVLAPQVRTHPTWLEFETSLRTEGGRALLGALISMTPGTLTAAIDGSRLDVHFLDTVDPQKETDRIRQRLEAPVEELERLLVGDLAGSVMEASAKGGSSHD